MRFGSVNWYDLSSEDSQNLIGRWMKAFAYDYSEQDVVLGCEKQRP